MPSNTFYLDTLGALVAMAAAGRLVPGSIYDVKGAPFRAQTSTQYVSTNGQQHTALGYRGLVIGASGDGRCYAVVNLQSNTISISSGTISFRSIAAYPMRKGHRIRLGANNFPEMECIATVVSTTPESGGTRVIATIDPATPLADFAAGHVTGTDITMGDMQCLSTTAGYTSMLQLLSGGRLDLTVLGSSGTIIQDWLVPERVAQVRSFGHMPFIIFGIGISGNALNANGQAGDTAADALEQLIQLHAGQFDKIYIGDVSCLTDEFGDGSGAGGQNTATYAAGQRYLNRMDELTTKYPNVVRVPINSYEVVVDSGTDTQAGLNAFCAVTDKQDDGVHPVWGAAWAEAEAYWQIIRRDFPFRQTGMLVKPFCVIRSPTPDSGGKQVRNLAEGLFGTVPATANVPNCCSGLVSNLNGMTVTNRLIPSRNGGSEWQAIVNSNGNTGLSGTVVSQIYSGTPGATDLLGQLNNPALRGKPIKIIWDAGVYGFNELSMAFTELCLDVDTGDGLGFLEIAAAFSINGLFNASGSVYSTGVYAGTRAAMSSGYWGMCPFPTFTIDPTLPNFTATRIRQTAKPKTGSDPGVFAMRMGPRSIIMPDW